MARLRVAFHCPEPRTGSLLLTSSRPASNSADGRCQLNTTHNTPGALTIIADAEAPTVAQANGGHSRNRRRRADATSSISSKSCARFGLASRSSTASS